MVEVAVAAVAEAVAGHVDRRAKLAAFEQVGQLTALVGVQQGFADREPPAVESGAQLVPGQRVDTLAMVTAELTMLMVMGPFAVV